jgi:hypothetical protein
VIDAMAGANVEVADSIYFDDPIFKGGKWTTERFDAGGTADPDSHQITIVGPMSCEDAATTIYHEAWHYKKQAKVKGWPHYQEDDAYYNTELMTIRRGWGTQAKHLPNGKPINLRTKDSSGPITPNEQTIYDFVEAAYPAPPPPIAGKPQPKPIGHNPNTNETYVKDPATGKKWWRPSQEGDRYDGEEKKVNSRAVSGSEWKC